MTNERAWQNVIGMSPLLFAIAYLWNPWGQRGSIVDFVLYSLAIWAAVKNPFKGKPRSALAVCIGYGLTATILVVNAVLRHTRRDLKWTVVFLGFTIVWGINFHRDTKGSAAATENHG